MERKNIPFQYGIHRSPSAAFDGELAECINLEVHKGELTPSVMPQVAFSLREGDKLLFVHKSGNYKNYIIQRGTDLCWFPDKNISSTTVIGQITPTSIHAVGNTLVVLSHDHMEYILYKSGKYRMIGSKPPFCSISFGMKSSLAVGSGTSVLDSFTIKGSAASSDPKGFIAGLEKYFEDGTMPEEVSFAELYAQIETDNAVPMQGKEYVDAMTETSAKLVNKFIADQNKFSQFTGSFYIRYAYRMYDGSHYMHSSPIFFPVNTQGPLITPSHIETVDEYDKKVMVRLSTSSCQLDAQIIGFYNENGGKVDNSLIDDWSDIITGIDIFATKQIYKHKQDGYVWGYSDKTALYEKETSSISSTFKRSTEGIGQTPYKRNSYKDEFGAYASLSFTLQENDKYFEQIKDASLFYKIAELKDYSSDKAYARRMLTIEEDTLTNIEQKEVLEDDYDSHNSIIPSFAHVYNGRLNISGIRTKLFSGYPMESMVPYTYVEGETNYTWHVRTTLELEGKQVDVVSRSNILLYEKPAFIYYPSPKVRAFEIHMYENADVISSFSITPEAETHKLLNGAFYLSPSFGSEDFYTLASRYPRPSGDPYIAEPNKIYTSEVNNPFHFPLSGRNNIGTGEIIAITSNTKAISPGQFGQFPLIVFSTDGVWAMQTGEEGLYYSIHPISKDICINQNVLQTDGPVIFATENGLHSIMADTVQNISQTIKGTPEQVNIPVTDDPYTVLSETATDGDTFTQFIRQALFAYDYANSRVVMYNPDKSFAYCLQADSGMFSKLVLLNEGIPVRMERIVSAYPEIYMQSGTDIYTFVPDTDTTQAGSAGILVTRTMAFSDPLAMKTINDVRLIYRRSSSLSRCRYAMYTSNDGFSWIQQTSLHGRSYKYFRFAIFTDLTDTDALQGMSVAFTYKRTNKLR